MATKKITFDPDAGVPVASNLTIYTGADFNAPLMFIMYQIQRIVSLTEDLLLIGVVRHKYKKVLV